MADLKNRFADADGLASPDLWPEIRRRAAEPGGPPPWLEGPRGGRIVAGAVAFALFVGGSVLAARVFLGGETGVERPRASSPWSDVPLGWTQLDPPPAARSDRAAVWTGEELILWGGGTDYTANFFADGAAYDPRTGWRAIADGPLTARADASAVWTGSEMLIWGGFGRSGPVNDGGAYDPASDTWRMLPKAPWELPWPAAVAWTGRELVLFGSTDRQKGEVSGMAYSPAADSWRTIASAPMALNQASSVWTGSEVIVYGSELNGRNIASERWAQGMAYESEADTWRVLPEHHISPQASWANWTGSEMLVWDYETNSALYDPSTNSWREPNPMPIEFSECYPYSVATSEIVFASFCNQMAQFDIATGRWSQVPTDPIDEPTPPHSGAVPVAADEVVLVLIARPDGNNYSGEIDEMWAYRPA